MRTSYLKMGKRITKRLLGMGAKDKQVDRIYKGGDYLVAYSRHTDLRVLEDPKDAIGGAWEEIGPLQFDFLIQNGMKPHHRMLDIGCGTLRGGRFAIQYLDRGNYHGMDISPKAIEYAQQLVKDEGLFEKTPHLFVSEKKDLKFEQLSGKTFDYILAQSVFTHLKPEHIRECFAHVTDIMSETSTFYFTFSESTEHVQASHKDFKYPFSFFESLAAEYGYSLFDCSHAYAHPRHQRMVRLKKASHVTESKHECAC